MSNTLTPVITDAGLQAVFTANNAGIQAEIAQLALGDGGYTPNKGRTALQNERARIAIADAARVTGTQIHLTGLLDGDAEFWVREVGFVLADGTLLAVWSHASQALAYKAAGVDLLLAFDLVMAALPADSVMVQGTGQNLNLYIAEELAQIASAHIRHAKAQVRTMHRQIQLNDRLLAIGA
jgi:hypothetical protein